MLLGDEIQQPHRKALPEVSYTGAKQKEIGQVLLDAQLPSAANTMSNSWPLTGSML
jgi:hypothetical protein